MLQTKVALQLVPFRGPSCNFTKWREAGTNDHPLHPPNLKETHLGCLMLSSDAFFEKCVEDPWTWMGKNGQSLLLHTMRPSVRRSAQDRCDGSRLSSHEGTEEMRRLSADAQSIRDSPPCGVLTHPSCPG